MRDSCILPVGEFNVKMTKKLYQKIVIVTPAILLVGLGLVLGVVDSYGKAVAQTTVGQWDPVKIPVPNSERYTDPYKDANLTVLYSRPYGSTVNFSGFYDVGQTWKTRFMADQLGT